MSKLLSKHYAVESANANVWVICQKKLISTGKCERKLCIIVQFLLDEAFAN